MIIKTKFKKLEYINKKKKFLISVNINNFLYNPIIAIFTVKP